MKEAVKLSACEVVIVLTLVWISPSHDPSGVSWWLRGPSKECDCPSRKSMLMRLINCSFVRGSLVAIRARCCLCAFILLRFSSVHIVPAPRLNELQIHFARCGGLWTHPTNLVDAASPHRTTSSRSVCFAMHRKSQAYGLAGGKEWMLCYLKFLEGGVFDVLLHIFDFVGLHF